MSFARISAAVVEQLFVNGYQQLIPQALPQASANRLGAGL